MYSKMYSKRPTAVSHSDITLIPCILLRRNLVLFYLLFAVCCSFGVLVSVSAFAQDMKFFRIGTGGTGGTYYPVGGLIAHSISNPPGSRPCHKGGSCGVPGLVVIAQSSNGSVANINAIKSGALESGFAQSDIAYWAYQGTNAYAGKGAFKNLRAITSLYNESIHLVARKSAQIRSVRDLKGKRVSLDEPGSGTLVDTRLVLAAYGLSEADIDAEYIKPMPASVKIKDGQLDAFFIVAGYPTGSVTELTSSAGAKLVPITGPEAQTLVKQYGFFAHDVIPGGTYAGNDNDVSTISVGALWVVHEGTDAQLIYQISKALWNKTSRKLLDDGHAKGKSITLDTALDGIGIPLHPGAERYFREIGRLQ